MVRSFFFGRMDLTVSKITQPSSQEVVRIPHKWSLTDRKKWSEAARLMLSKQYWKLPTREKTKVDLRSEGVGGSRTRQFTVSVETHRGGSDRDRAEVWLAVTEGNLRSAVRSGENAGKDLPHSAVLRTLRKIGVVSPGQQSAVVFTASPQIKLSPIGKNKTFVSLFSFRKSKAGGFWEQRMSELRNNIPCRFRTLDHPVIILPEPHLCLPRIELSISNSSCRFVKRLAPFLP